MTVIAGIVEHGQVYLAADSLASGEDNRLRTLPDGKIWRAGDMLLGTVGGLREAQALRYGFTPPPVPEGQDAMAYLTGPFAAALREVLQVVGILENKAFSLGVIIGWRGRLFTVSERFCVAEHAEYWAEGIGGEVATGVLYATTAWPPRARLQHALEAAEHLCSGVRRPFTYLETQP